MSQTGTLLLYSFEIHQGWQRGSGSATHSVHSVLSNYSSFIEGHYKREEFTNANLQWCTYDELTFLNPLSPVIIIQILLTGLHTFH